MCRGRSHVVKHRFIHGPTGSAQLWTNHAPMSFPGFKRCADLGHIITNISCKLESKCIVIRTTSHKTNMLNHELFTNNDFKWNQIYSTDTLIEMMGKWIHLWAYHVRTRKLQLFSKQKTFNQWCFNVSPPSATLYQHKTSIGSMASTCWDTRGVFVWLDNSSSAYHD